MSNLGPWCVRRRFRPTFWASVATLCALTVLLGLGTWQVQRLHWKEALIAQRQARGGAPAIALPAVLDDPAALEYRRVALAGRFLHDQEMYLGNRMHRGRVGYAVMTPLLLDDGRQLLVERGWIPMDRRDPASRAEGQVAGRVALEAMLRVGGWKGRDFVRPDNQPAENFWFWVDPPAMAAQAGLERPVTEVYAVALAGNAPGGLPIPAEARVTLRNDHLGYALTWYALAVVLLIIYVIYHTRRDPGP
jgi:surfeit locus 1 family protein